MKKTLIAIAALAAAGASFAQSSVTIAGNVNMQYNSEYNGTDKGFGINFANLRLSGTEDLGGGMRASFVSEVGFGDKRNASTVKRDTSLGLVGGFGSVSIANTRSSNYLVTYGMVGTNNNGWNGPYDHNANVISRVPIDVIGWGMPVGPVSIGLSYSESGTDGNSIVTKDAKTEAVTSTDLTKTFTAAVTYAAGPMTMGLRAHSSKDVDWPAGRNKSSVEFGATYNLGVAKIGVGADTKRRGQPSTDKGGLALGVSAPLGPVNLGLGYIKRGSHNNKELSVVYALSKRTGLEFNFADTTTQAKNTYSLVLTHAF